MNNENYKIMTIVLQMTKNTINGLITIVITIIIIKYVTSLTKFLKLQWSVFINELF